MAKRIEIVGRSKFVAAHYIVNMLAITFKVRGSVTK